jgi:K+-sensing histidine kinase KdpD
MPWVGTFSVSNDVGQFLFDVATLSDSSAVWPESQVADIVRHIANALLSVLKADFLYILIPATSQAPGVDILYTAAQISADRREGVLAALKSDLPQQSFAEGEIALDAFSPKPMRVFASSIGIGGGAFVVVGSRREDFPAHIDRMLVAIGARQVAVATRHLHAGAMLASRTSSAARVRELQLENLDAARFSATVQIVTGIAHELSQPLTAVVNSLNTANRLLAKHERMVDGSLREALGDAVGQSLAAIRFLRRLSGTAKRRWITTRVVSIATVIGDAAAVALSPGMSDIALKIQFDPSALRVVVDPVYIRQVMVDLIRCAVFGLHESTYKSIDIVTRSIEAQMIEVAVTYTGKTLSEAVGGGLSEPFVLPKGYDSSFGLSLCRSIVDMHGGTFSAEPPRNQDGAIFRFTIPKAPPGEYDAKAANGLRGG